MPIYEYKCEDCSLQFEVKRSFNDKAVAPCPKCKGKTHRVFSLVPIIFKASGFYVTDNRKNDSAPEELKDASSSYSPS